MRIAIVCASDAEGGLEKHVIELSTGLADLGHEVTVVAPHGLASRLSSNVTLCAVNMHRSRWSPWLRRDLRKALVGEWDVVHAHANKAAQLVSVVASAIKTRRLVATLHNRKSDTSMFLSFNDVIVVSSQLKATLTHDRVSVVLNGVDVKPAGAAATRDWLASEAGLDPSRPIVLGLGRLVHAKGFDRMIAATTLAGVQLAIAGDGPDRDVLSRQSLLQAGADVSLLGFRPDVSRLLSACDGLLITARNEGGPYTLAEALLAGRPVLSTSVGMVPDVLPPDMILPEDIEGMAAMIKHWASQPESWHEACSEAMHTARHRLTLAGMIANTVNVYRGESESPRPTP